MQEKIDNEYLNFDKERDKFLEETEILNNLIIKLLEEYNEEECKKKYEELKNKINEESKGIFKNLINFIR